jgi:hypothetical protein
VLSLLAMFSIASRYSIVSILLPKPGTMRAAGTNYMQDANVTPEDSYAQLLVSTCQALLLLNSHEIEISVMAPI